MLEKPLGQINAAARTQVSAFAETVRGEFGLPEVLATLGARRHRVIEAVLDEQGALFRTQIAKSLAVGVGETVFAKLNRVFGRDQPQTSRTLQLGHDRTACENGCCRLGDCPSRHGLAESALPLEEQCFSLADQDIGSVACLLALLHQLLRRLSHCLCPATYFGRQHRAAKEMRPSARCEIRATP
jgi:hypothetical protein